MEKYSNANDLNFKDVFSYKEKSFILKLLLIISLYNVKLLGHERVSGLHYSNKRANIFSNTLTSILFLYLSLKRVLNY